MWPFKKKEEQKPEVQVVEKLIEVVDPEHIKKLDAILDRQDALESRILDLDEKESPKPEAKKPERVALYFVGQAKDKEGKLIGCYAAKDDGHPLQLSVYSLKDIVVYPDGGATWIDLNEVE